MMDNYLSGGVERIYWLTVPTQRDPARKPIADDGQPGDPAGGGRARRRGPGGRPACRPSRPATPTGTRSTIDGKQTIVRESDGIHLNEDGSSVAADLVLEAVDRDFDY